MVSGIGLGKFNPIEMKETPRSSKPSSFDSESSVKDSTPAHRSSASQNKTLGKSSDHDSEFNKKVESYSKDKSSEKSNHEEKSASIDSDKLDKKDVKEAQKELQKDNHSEIPQMLMLQGVQPVFVNQQAQPAAEVKAQNDVDLNLKVSSQTQPVLRFMKAMQENFGISPQQIMKALGEMPQQTLMKSPHEAMTPLFEKLGLQPRQFTKAQILYTEMLTDMEKVEPESFQGKLPIASGTALGAMSAMKSSELPAQMIERPMTAAPKSTLDQLIEQKISRRALEPGNRQGVFKVPPQQPESMAQVFKIDPKQMGIADTKNNIPDGLAIDKLKEFDPQLRIEDVKINPSKVTEQFSSSAPILGGGAAVSALAAAEGKKEKENSKDDLKDNLSEQMMQMPADKKVDGQFAMDKLGATAAAPATQHQNQLSNENVEKLISGSQALLKKGGGEMKIQLNPEGLGKIHLNIKVENGQVGVQMMADTQEAKKLLETSMNDLKLGLAEHKLNLNHSKVDVSEQSSQNMTQSQDFKREEARDFLGQFRQFNESFRQGANDLSGVKAYRKSTQSPTPDIQPLESRRSDPTKSGGLYLVA